MTEGPQNYSFLNIQKTGSEKVLNTETSEEERARAEAIEKLEEKIKATKQRLAEIDKMLKIDSLKEELALKREKLLKSTFGKNKKREEIASLETKLDRIENPFKWFTIDSMCRKNFAVLFESDTRSAEVVDAEVYFHNPKGVACEIFEKPLESISDKTDNAVMFSSNGFYLRLKNRKELQKAGGIIIDGPEAIYDLVGPGGLILSKDLSYESAIRTLREIAPKYQAEQLTSFEKLNPAD